MKKNYFLFLCSFLLLGSTALAQLGTDNFTLGSDDTSNYSSWTNGSNQGSGFGTWSFSDSGSGNRGHYYGPSGQGNPSFAIYSEGAGVFAAAERSLNSDLKPGDRFSVDLGHTSTINGEIFIQLTDDSSPVFTLKFVGGDDRWRMNDGGSDFDSGQLYSANTSITFTFIYNDDGTYSYSFGTGSGSNITAVNTISGINGFKFQSTDQGGSQNFGINNLSHTSKYTIPNGSSTTVTSTTEIPYLTVESGGAVTINSGFGLNITGNLTNSGTVTAIDGASLGVDGTASGNITYKRSVSTDNWYLMASPVVGETSVDFINNSGNIGWNGSEWAVGTYSDGWTYNYSGPLNSGYGYAVHKTTAGDLVFTGTFQSADVDVTIFDTDPDGPLDFNLYGNPYLSFVAVNSSANATDNILDVNSTKLAQETIWLWNQANNDYDIINQTGAFFLAPGQGFFIKAGGSGAVFNFTEAMTSHVNSDSFQKSAVKKTSRPEIKLFINDGTTSKHTDIFYINGTTTGFDNGYDSSIFGGASISFKVFTGLVSDSQGEKLGIQSLPDSGYENMTVPVGIIADANTEITFTANTTNIPSGLKVFLEDRETNTFTRLDEANGEYKVTMSQDVNDVGRFYLHTTASALSVPEVHLENVSVYTTHATNIRIEGIALGKTQMKLVNMLGKEVLQQNFSSNGVSDIAIPKLARGIYIVQLNTEKGKLNKKIIID